MEFRYNRVLLKLSGEALLGNQAYGIDPERVQQYAKEVHNIANAGVEVAIVIGGGNIYRGINAEKTGIDRVSGDYMGMLGTIINGVALQNALEKEGSYTRLMSALSINTVCEDYIRRRAIRHLEKGRIVIFVAGTGNPYFTTDTAASLRAVEMEVDIILKGTRVDGIYSSDPEKDETATKYEVITYNEIFDKELKVMDLTAFAMSKENKIPIRVFDMNKVGNLQKIVEGENVGTLVTS